MPSSPSVASAFRPRHLLAVFCSWRSTDILGILSRISHETAPGAELLTDGREQSCQLYNVGSAFSTQPESEPTENVETVKSTKESYRRQQKPDDRPYH
jgi:hypothetical protein